MKFFKITKSRLYLKQCCPDMRKVIKCYTDASRISSNKVEYAKFYNKLNNWIGEASDYNEQLQFCPYCGKKFEIMQQSSITDSMEVDEENVYVKIH